MTRQLYAQGDILIERVDEIAAERCIPTRRDPDGAIVLGRGERSGHRHAIHDDGAKLVVDFSSRRDVPRGLYVGHLVVEGEKATVVHEEHGAIDLPKGTYRVRRQRQYSNATERRERLVAD